MRRPPACAAGCPGSASTAHDLVAGNPTIGVERPEVDPDHTATVGLDRERARAMVAAADADGGVHRLRTALAIRLLLHNALRVNEMCAADLADLGSDRGHRVLGIVGKGNRKAKIPLTPGTLVALETYLAERQPAPACRSRHWPGRCWPPAPAVG